MSDIFREVDEELRRDQFAKFWKRYGNAVIGAAILIVVATAGTTVWKNWQQSQAVEQTDRIAAAVRQAQTGNGVAEATEALKGVAAEGGASRELIAQLYEAAFLAESGKRDEAAQLYDAIASSGAEAAYRDIATLLGVLHRVESGDPAQLRDRLKPLLADTSPWRYSAREIDAVLLARTGDRAAAAEALRKLAEDNEAPQGIRSRAGQLAAVYGGAS